MQRPKEVKAVMTFKEQIHNRFEVSLYVFREDLSCRVYEGSWARRKAKALKRKGLDIAVSYKWRGPNVYTTY